MRKVSARVDTRSQGQGRSAPVGTRADEPVIVVEDLWFHYGDSAVVAGAELCVRAGERVAILGSTGAGKSTLLNLLIGTLVPDSGRVAVTGLAPSTRPKELFGRFAIAFQTPRLLPWRTALDNVALGLQILGRSRSESRRVAREWLGRVGLSDALHLYPNQLSGGMKQRASLARAFAIRPRVLFLDEAFSALDEVTAERLRQDFHTLSTQESTTAVIVTHDIDEALFLADRVLILGRPARVIGEFAAAEIDWKRDPSVRADVRDRIIQIMTSGPAVPADAAAQP
jgi:NitT/TauT family transport system ATP-binding protein